MIYTESYWLDIKTVIKNIPNIEELYLKKILITGASGMIGSAVAELLFYLNRECDAGIDIFLAGRSEEKMSRRFYLFSGEYTFIKYDAIEAPSIHIVPDYIIHGAGNANPSVYTKQPVETMLGNFIGLNALLHMAAEKKCKRVLYISSSEVYGNKTINEPYIESDCGTLDILNPRACYPNAKRASETLCVSYKDEYGIDVVIVRPGHIYGPAITETDNRASAQFTRNVVNGQDIVMKSAGTQIRSYCYTLDCASAILTVLLKGASGNAYNISNKNSLVSIRDLAEIFAACSGTNVIFEHPSDAEKRGYNLMQNSALYSDKLESLGWKACFGPQAGVMKTIQYFKEG
ncbi:MAG: NAD-dependent epimerase/dehydratase family protein [Lachnospiraceae bacterium]|jgi:nucleoside-diphosphate-sugar epimerase|nr:NAD-dependent epimerase/dehydratase family protein [Lachnospiraceae bacterium]